jgi:hypothetical protein
LSITCDNASANDKMIQELGNVLDRYPGEEARVRCFCHVINLVVKSIISQFDVPSKKVLDAGAAELRKLTIDVEEGATEAREARVQNNVDAGSVAKLRKLAIDIGEEEAAEVRADQQTKGPGTDAQDNADGWEDERDGMTEEELRELEVDVLPAQCMLTKVRVTPTVSPPLSHLISLISMAFADPLSSHTVAQSLVCHQEFLHNPSASLACNMQGARPF